MDPHFKDTFDPDEAPRIAFVQKQLAAVGPLEGHPILSEDSECDSNDGLGLIELIFGILFLPEDLIELGSADVDVLHQLSCLDVVVNYFPR